MLQPDESMHCSDYARSIDLSPAGSAIEAVVLAVIETPLPWPKPVFDHSLLGGLTSKLVTRSGHGRILASVPGPGVESGHVRARTFWRSSEGTMMAQHIIGQAQITQFVSEVSDSAQAAESFVTDIGAATKHSLVCTQGSHDICCGGAGMRYAVAAENTNSTSETLRVSHTGGHRFAPTAMDLPSGRMWAYLTEGDAQKISDRSVPTSELASKCRGWWGAATGAAQVAEIAVWSDVGWAWDDANDRHVRVGDSGLVQVTGLGRRWEVEVVKGRQVPSIACNKPGGQPTKPGQEWDLVGLREF